MKKYIVSLAVFLLISPAFAENISLSKAAELACHRIERLVTLKKIDESFVNYLGTLIVETPKQNLPTDAVFRVVAAQYPSEDGGASQIEIFMDSQGKTLSYNITGGTKPLKAPIWPDKDSVTLIENALHYVLEGWQDSNPLVKPFLTDLKSLRLSQIKDNSGQVLAKTEFWSAAVGTRLEVLLKVDGTFVSAEVK